MSYIYFCLTFIYTNTYLSIVYEPKERDNEEKSAALFKEFSSHFEPKVCFYT